MNNERKITIKEFDSIVCGQSNSIDNKNICINERHFTELENFIYDYSSNRYDVNINEFVKFGYKKGIKKVVTIANYVGLIQLPSGYQIEILPKIDFLENDNKENETKKVFIEMLKSLYGFNGKKLLLSSLDINKVTIFDIFISLYVEEINNIVRKGIKSDYISIDDNLISLKGKINIAANLRKNMGRNEKHFVTYDEYLINRSENRILKSTLIYLSKITYSSNLRNEIKKTLLFFDRVENSINIDRDIKLCKLDRGMNYYKRALEWSEIFLYGRSFTSFSGQNTGMAMLFPMETLFEKYVAKKIKNEFEADGWIVKLQDSTNYLFENPSKKFLLKPDIVMEKHGVKIILDTKWKRLINNEKKNYDISQADMYQMYAYSNKYVNNGIKSQVYLLYPRNLEFKASEIPSYTNKEGVVVNIHFIDLQPNLLNNSIKHLKNRISLLNV